jgi:hypothetical protein
LRSLAKVFISLAIGASVFGQTYTIQTIAGGAFPADGPAKSAVLGLIGGVALDTSGNLYVALHSSHMVVKVDSSGNLTRIAGTGVYGFSGDGGPATSAQIAYPQGLVYKNGVLYIQDGGNQRVRMVSSGTISTVPGTEGLLGVTQGLYFGQNTGLNRLPTFSSLGVLASGMAVDSTGALYISDTINHRIFKVTGGAASVFAGTGEPGFSGDGGLAKRGQLNNPFGLAVDSSDNLFIADTHNNRIREILATTGYIYTISGQGIPGYSGDSSDATGAAVNNPMGLAFDSSDNLYIADSGNFVIRKIWKQSHVSTTDEDTTISANVIETVAGSGTWGQSWDGTTATRARVGVPVALAADSSGNVYFSDVDHQRVMLMSNDVVSTVAGGGTEIGDNGPATDAQLVWPLGVATDSTGNVYSLDMARHGVRRISGGMISTVAGNGAYGGAGDYGAAAAAQLSAIGIASDATGNLFLATPGNYLAVPNGGRIRKVTGGNIFSVAGTGQLGYGGDGNLASNATLNDPMGVAVDGSGNIYFADTHNYRIRKVSAQSKIISTIAGDGTNAYNGDNAAATNAQLSRPFRIAVDAAGNTYIADFDNSVIRKVTATTGVITTIAGTGTAGYSGDNGLASNAQIDRPSALAVNAAGDLFFFDLGNNVLRKVDASTGVISTVAGNGIRGFSGDMGLALNAELGRSYGIAVDNSGNIYLADVDNNVIRKLSTGQAACTFTVTPLASQVSASGGFVTLTIAANASSCAWSLPTLPTWITGSTASSGMGTARVTLTVSANGGVARSATLNILGSTVTITQAAGVCTYVTSPAGQFFASAGGAGTFQVIADGGCGWKVTGTQSWIALTGATSGSGNATVSYQVAANSGATRQATLSVGGAAYTIEQSAGAVSGLVNAGSMAHFASAGGWKTTFTLVNTGASAATAQLDFTGDNGSAVVLPLSLPQTGETDLSGSTIQRSLAAGAVLPIVSTGLTGDKGKTGEARLLSTGSINGFSVFEFQPSTDSTRQEAVVPLETRSANTYLLAFDNTNGYSTGIAVSNTSSQTANVQVTVRNGAGATIKSRSLQLAAGGHSSFDLVTNYPETADLIGTLQFTTSSAGQIGVLGIRVNSQNSFTSVPALVPSSQTTGSIAHFASGGGYKTSFTLVNTGTTAATARLSFFDDNGAPVTLPLGLPQTGTTLPSAPTFEQTIAAGATLIVESEGPSTLAGITGSAQLQTSGNVSGFALFRRLPTEGARQQEAVVPLETRNGSSYILAYDNTGGYVYGIAVANNSDQAANIAVTIRDAKTGAVTGSSHTITLPAKGHEAFLLTDAAHGLPETANTSGTLEFSTSAAGQISVLGLRFNSDAAFTSVPALLKR